MLRTRGEMRDDLVSPRCSTWCPYSLKVFLHRSASV